MPGRSSGSSSSKLCIDCPGDLNSGLGCGGYYASADPYARLELLMAGCQTTSLD
jgi:hypothetical protein